MLSIQGKNTKLRNVESFSNKFGQIRQRKALMNVLFNIKSNYRGNQSSFRIQPNSHKLGIIFPQSFIVLDQFFWLACPCEKEEAPDDVGTDVRSGPLGRDHRRAAMTQDFLRNTLLTRTICFSEARYSGPPLSSDWASDEGSQSIGYLMRRR